jgi:hypothetical protein
MNSGKVLLKTSLSYLKFLFIYLLLFYCYIIIIYHHHHHFKANAPNLPPVPLVKQLTHTRGEKTTVESSKTLHIHTSAQQKQTIVIAQIYRQLNTLSFPWLNQTAACYKLIIKRPFRN